MAIRPHSVWMHLVVVCPLTPGEYRTLRPPIRTQRDRETVLAQVKTLAESLVSPTVQINSRP